MSNAFQTVPILIHVDLKRCPAGVYMSVCLPVCLSVFSLTKNVRKKCPNKISAKKCPKKMSAVDLRPKREPKRGARIEKNEKNKKITFGPKSILRHFKN